MSIKYRFAAAIAVVSLVACGSGGGAIPSPTPAPTVVPTGTVATIVARYQGNLLYNQPIELHANSGTAAAPVVDQTIITTVTTGPASNPATGGEAVFTGLTPATSYCWVYKYTPTTPPNVAVQAQACTSNWDPGFTLGG